MSVEKLTFRPWPFLAAVVAISSLFGELGVMLCDRARWAEKDGGVGRVTRTIGEEEEGVCGWAGLLGGDTGEDDMMTCFGLGLSILGVNMRRLL